ncbi:MAG: dTMP kinase [Chthoniobacterales bacterium]|nr:dTMP kinase [Chthoniobacterales bacterium]
MRRGLFVTFEGSEGCGKSTQIARLAEWIASRGLEPVITREPGGTPAGDEIRHLLQHAPQGHGLSAEAELLLFAASRAQLVRELIRPALDKGRVVISDRFHDSTTVYQGVARRLDPGMVTTINDFAVGGTVPDVTFVLDMDERKAFERLAKRDRPADRMESEPPEFYRAVREGYLRVAGQEPSRFAVLDASAPEENIAAQIRDTLLERFHGFFAR